MANRTGYKLTNQDKLPKHLLATAGAEKFNIPDGSLAKNQAELYQRLSWVNIAVGAVSKLSAEVPLSVKQIKGEDSTDVINHPFEVLLRRPNPLQSRFEFIQSTCAYYCLTGNAFWWMNKAAESSPPAELWMISPHRLTVVPDKKSFIQGYLYDPGDGSSIPIDKTEIVHFKSFHPSNPFVGLSPVEAIAIIAVGDMKAQEFNTSFFADNNAKLPGVLAFADPIENNEWELLKKDARDNSKKRNMMMLRNVGAGGVQWLQAGATQKDMEYLNGRKFTKEEIYAIFAPGLASMTDVNATEANAKTGEATLMKLAIHPMLSALAEKITNDLLPLYGENLTCEFDEVREKDRLIALQEEQAFSAVHTIEEIRLEMYGDDPLGDDRDKLLPVEMKPVQNLVQEPTEDTQPEENPELNTELKAYQRKACNALTKGKSLDFDFVSDTISQYQLNKIKSALKDCKTKDEVKAVFAKEENNEVKPAGLDELIGALTEATKALREA